MLLFYILILLSWGIDKSLGFGSLLSQQKIAPWPTIKGLWTAGDIGSVGVDHLEKNSSNALMKEALILQARAKQLKDEIKRMESELKSKRGENYAETDKLIDNLILLSTNSTSSEMVSEWLQEAQWRPSGVLRVVDRISQRQASALSQNTSSLSFNSGATQNETVQINETDYELLTGAMDTLLGAVAILDKGWSERASFSVRSRNLGAEEVNQANSVTALNNQFDSLSVMLNTSSSAVEVNSSDLLEGIPLIPVWVPSPFLPFIIACNKSTLGPEQVESIANDVLMGSRFYLTSHESVSGAAIFRGNIRTHGTVDMELPKNDTAKVFGQIQDRLKKKGLSDDVQLFLLPDPEWRQGQDERELDPKPVVLALSKAVSPDESKIENFTGIEVLRKSMYPISVVTTFLSFVVAYSLNISFFDKCVRQRNLSMLRKCVPPTIGVILVQTLHEVAHYVVAKKRNIKIGCPVPLPSFQLGLFGCITPMRSFPKTRSDLLDVALSGPLAGLAMSIGCLVAGIMLSTRASALNIASFPVVPALTLKSSFFIGTCLSFMASKTLMLPLAQPVPVHPLFLVGYAGLFASGLNLLPIFRLDGGRASSAVFGQRSAAVLSVTMLLFLFSCTLSGKMGTGFTWILLISIFQRRQEIPAMDEVTGVDRKRLSIFLLSFLLSVSIITPFPGGTSLL